MAPPLPRRHLRLDRSIPSATPSGPRGSPSPTPSAPPLRPHPDRLTMLTMFKGFRSDSLVLTTTVPLYHCTTVPLGLDTDLRLP
eukprot:1195820-Prorocentrum_minimum.AAC.2